MERTRIPVAAKTALAEAKAEQSQATATSTLTTTPVDSNATPEETKKDKFKDGFFVFLFPQDNLHCQKAIEQYKNCLTDKKTFQSWTLEDVAEVISQNTKDNWIDDVIDRYLNFGKIDTLAEK